MGYPRASILSCVLVSKSLTSWRSRNCSSGGPLARLTIRPRLTAGRFPISFVQRVRFLYSCVCRNLPRVVVGGAVHHAVAVPRPDRHIGDCILVAGDELIVRELPVEHVELAFQLHCKTVDGVFDFHRSVGVEMPEAAAPDRASNPSARTASSAPRCACRDPLAGRRRIYPPGRAGSRRIRTHLI